MEPKTVILLLAIIALLAGGYTIYASIKNKHKDYSHRKLKHRIIQNVLGVDGARIFYGFLGIGLIIFGGFILFQFYVKPNLGNEYNNKTDQFTLVSKTLSTGDYTMTSSTTSTLKQLETSLKITGEEKLQDYVSADFSNNYLNQIPEIVWKMKNLKRIDFTYNNITEIDLTQLSKMDSLTTIILSNNPISIAKIKTLKETTNLEIIH
ncbi:leucine-rich repeat domain-containing protein [Cellulophaga baltica 4]|uniref:leucine-rich repeat domain-containing protein n=1 Tax=Cellulophaga baltica TaxID=76594 RepID=UPI00041E727E|nr:leucine-rich repeat domain-containing protein [Cellulophaga baltica 4]